jgi:Asp/Glu/hydantoin racemase
MRLLMLNPNTSQSVTDLIAAAARAAAAPGTEIVPATAPRGVPYISNRAEAVIGGAVALEMLASLHSTVDAAVIAAFADPALGGAREMFPLPVIGLAEAGMLTACMLGARFAVVTFAQAMEPWYRECVEWHRLERRCAGIRALGGGFRDIGSVQHEKESLLVELAGRAVEDDGADVVVLAGAPLAGLAARVADRIPVPVVDCVAASVKQAEALVALGPRKATRGTYRRPDAKESTGLDPALADWIAHRSPG